MRKPIHNKRKSEALQQNLIFGNATFPFQQYSKAVEFPVYIPKQVEQPLENKFNQVAKRAFDIVFSSLVVLFVFPWLMPIVALIIKLESKGNVFFVQERSGENDKGFPCLKFRSMAVNTASDSKQATRGDARITKFGAFMRKTSIDELPQFINVLFGHMTVVGPRPHMLKHTVEYTEKIPYYAERLAVKPGVTGWAQVNGFRGPTDTLDKMVGRVDHDIWYIKNWSFLLDLKCIVKTVTNVFEGEDNAF